MRLTLLRNATLVIDAGGHRILVDPMLSPARALPPFAVLRHRAARNPTVGLPPCADTMLIGVDLCLISHFRRGHVDHLDAPGRHLLRTNGIPTYCRAEDAPVLRADGLRAVPVDTARTPFGSGTVRAIHAQHGRGAIGKLMGCGSGFVVRMPGEPSLYLSGDTVWTEHVGGTLADEAPDVAVVHAGGASVDVGDPILMPLDEVRRFAERAPRDVVAVHLEALNHCPTTRAQVRALADEPRIGPRLHVPADGETLAFEAPTRS